MEVMAATAKTIGSEQYIYYVGSGGIKRYVQPDMSPYFFVSEKYRSVLKDNIKAKVDFNFELESGEYYFLNGEKLLKVITELDNDHFILGKEIEMMGLETYERDIRFYKRWFYDKRHKLPTNCSKAYFDLEVDSRNGFPEPSIAKERILSIAVVDDNGKEFFFSDMDEKKIIKDFMECANSYSILGGWNIEHFDKEYLKNRMKMLEIKRNDFFELHQFIDLMRLYKFATFNAKPSYSLENVSQDELGTGKKQDFWTLKRAVTLWDAFIKRKDLLRDYNVGDTSLVYQLDKKLDLVNSAINLINRFGGGMFLEDFQYVSRGITALILAEAEDCVPRPVFPNKPSKSETEKESYTGAFIMEPEVGLHHNIVEMDFKGFYPTTIETFRISPENIAKSKENAVRTKVLSFNKGLKEPLYVKILNVITDIRDKLKSEFQQTSDKKLKMQEQYAKMYAVSFYGTAGNRNLRIYNRDIAESITLTCQDIIQKAISIAAKYGFHTCYAHSVDGSTEISFMDGDKMPIKDCYKYRKDVVGRNVFALKDSAEVGSGKIARVIRHKRYEDMYEIITESGKKVRVTENHSLLIKKGNSVVITNCNNLKIGDLVYVED